MKNWFVYCMLVLYLWTVAECNQNEQFKFQRDQSKQFSNTDDLKYRNLFYNIARSIPRVGRKASFFDKDDGGSTDYNFQYDQPNYETMNVNSESENQLLLKNIIKLLSPNE